MICSGRDKIETPEQVIHTSKNLEKSHVPIVTAFIETDV